jgi:hypothetical protein
MKVWEANESYNCSIEGLSNELDRVYQLEARLRAVQHECSEACKNTEPAKAEKGKLEVEMEKLEAKKEKALKI